MLHLHSRLLSRWFMISASVAGGLAPAGLAHAQTDVERPLPNVLLLVDTSGSMEFRADADAFPTCNPGNPNATNEKSRWIDLVEVLTGALENYSCFAMDRSSEDFRSEFSLNNTPPYDLNYINPYHRALSGSCAVGPGVAPSSSNPYEFPNKGINTFQFTPSPGRVQRPQDLATHPGCNGFLQAEDGIMDVFKEKVRFGLMTFDSHTSEGTGIVNGIAHPVSGMEGTWSYFLNQWQTGLPAGCGSPQAQEVGARNAAAPPWEGRMVAFGSPSALGSSIEQRNQRIQEVLLATRPYGATPIAGLLHDARDFLWNDTSKDPLDPSGLADFGPRSDPQTQAQECRRTIVILLSDGEPNLDLRPFCENAESGGRCPYDRPEEIAEALFHGRPESPNQVAEVLAIGFGLSRVTPQGGTEIGCAELTDQQCVANPTNRAIQACCTLNKIAALGGRPLPDGTLRKAYFPQDRKELRRAFSSILSDVTTHLTTRTSAAFASVGSAGGGNYQFSSSFTPLLEEPWRGNLVRTRIECNDEGQPVERPVEVARGDDFGANLGSGAGAARRFYTFVPETSSRNTLRPYLQTLTDGIDNGGGSMTQGLGASNLVTAVPPAAMEVGSTSCEGGSSTACRDAILGWSIGLTNAEGETRCAAPGENCNLLGAIYHSTPKIVPGSPAEFLRDESYQAFVAAQRSKGRPSVLYTASIDGQLHAFKTAPQNLQDSNALVNTQRNNELWAFLPPAVLPLLQAQYPNVPATLLDGVPVIKDVPVNLAGTAFERPPAEAQGGIGGWRTVLVMGFGKGQVDGGYFALDVTNPDPEQGGPKFLWQLTRDGDGKRLFGNGGIPLLTTVFVKSGVNDPGKEVAVAVLPGGDQGSRSGSGTSAVGELMETKETRFAAALEVNAYNGADEARSLTIVRLDNGEIIRTFRSSLPNPPVNQIAVGVTTVVDIPAPLVGQPAAFPAATGSVADRIFLGDREGRLWRLDVSNPDPSRWTLKVFFDAFFDKPLSSRQPIETPPIVSVDEAGQITVAASTGEQRVQSAGDGMLNRVFSLTEAQGTSFEFQADVNWVETLGCESTCGAGQLRGERVTGSMSLFSTSLYFATSSPATSEAIGQCGLGHARVWGVHYTRSLDEARQAQQPDPMNGAAGAMLNPEGAELAPKSTDPEPGMVFGVSIEQQPACSLAAEDFTDDPYLGGFGSHSAMSSVRPASFSLVYQVGGGVSGGGSSKVPTERVDLSPPRATVLIDSWAPIFE